MERLLVSVDEAAEAIGGSRSTVYRLITQGELSRVKVGSRALVTVDSVREYVARLTSDSMSADAR